MKNYTATYMSGMGLIVRPEVSYQSVEVTLREAELAHQESRKAYEKEGFVWDEEALGWYISQNTLLARFPDADLAARAEWAESLYREPD